MVTRIWKLVVVAVLGMAAVAGAAIPDGPIRNAWETRPGAVEDLPGRLAERSSLPLSKEQIPVIWMHGWYATLDDPEGLPDADLEVLFESAWISVPIYFDEVAPLDFVDCFKDYTFSYNPNDAVDLNGGRLYRHGEAHPELTSGVSRIYIPHSMAGLVVQNLRERTRDKKFGGLLALGTPWHGAPVTQIDKVSKVLPSMALGLPVDKWMAEYLSKAKQHLASDGAVWLAVDHVGREASLDACPLDENCYLYAGTVTPILTIFSVDGALALDQMFDGLYGTKDKTKLHKSYRFTAGILERMGAGASDGMVPVSSAIASGDNARCNIRQDWQGDKNHTQVVTEAGLAAELHRQMAKDLWELYQKLRPDWRERVAQIDPAAGVAGISDLANFQTLPYRPEIAWARMVCANSNDGKAYLVAGGRREELRLGQARLSWPSWNVAGQLLVNREAKEGICPVVIDPDGTTKLLVSGAKWARLEAGGHRWVYWKDDKLVVGRVGDRSSERVVMSDARLRLVAPPVIVGDWVYLAHSLEKSLDSHLVCRVRIAPQSPATIEQLGATRDSQVLDRAALYYPTAYGKDVAGVAKLEDDQVLFKLLNRSWYPPNFNFAGVKIWDSIALEIRALDFDEVEGLYYFVADDQIRVMSDVAGREQYALAQEADSWPDRVDPSQGVEITDQSVIVTIDPDQVMPVVAPATQMAVRP